jgi:transcriptional regulator with XRE-family HTH domain
LPVVDTPAHERFAQWIEQRGLTLEGAGEALSVTKAAIWMIRTGARTPSPSLAEAIERWTAGGVPAASWPRDERERERLEAWEHIQPYQPPEPEEPADSATGATEAAELPDEAEDAS